MSDPSTPPSPGHLDAREEGLLLARYLLGREAPDAAPMAAARYAEGCARLFAEPGAGAPDDALARFARRHHWSLPCLDAAAGLLTPRALLRQKLILMLAILETMPALADDFMPRPRPRWLLLLGLARAGAATALKTLAGMALLPLARRAR